MKPAVSAFGTMKRCRKRSFARRKVAKRSATEMAPASITIFHDMPIRHLRYQTSVGRL